MKGLRDLFFKSLGLKRALSIILFMLASHPVVQAHAEIISQAAIILGAAGITHPFIEEFLKNLKKS